MEENEFFSRKGSCSPPSTLFPKLEQELLEASPIKKTISMKTNNLENFVPRLKPKRVYYSSKEIRTFSLDNDDSDCSDSDEPNKDDKCDQNKNTIITSQKKQSVVLSPKNRKLFLLKKLQPNTFQTKKSLFYLPKDDIDTSNNDDNNNNIKIQKENRKLNENGDTTKNETNDIQMDYDSDISDKSVDSFTLG